MGQPGGLKRGAGPNQYLAKVQCECETPIPQVDGDCMKCGHWIDAEGLAPLPSLYDSSPMAAREAKPALGRSRHTTGRATRI